MIFKVKKKKVFAQDQEIYEAPGIIVSSIPLNDKLILRYKIEPSERWQYNDEDRCQNILCLNFNGSVCWRLEAPPKATVPYAPYYIKLSKNSKNEFWAHDGSYSIQFNPNTGDILQRNFTK